MSYSNPQLSHDQLISVLSLTHGAFALHVTEKAVIEFANNAMLRIWDKDKSVIGKSLADALPELEGQPFIEMFARVWREGLVLSGTDTPATLMVDGKLQTFYFDFEYRAVKDADGSTYCILHTATDVTERFLKREALEAAFKQGEALAREQALNEELAAANEEIAAINEELRITNEELVQSKNDLEVINDELEDRVANRTLQLANSEARLRSVFEQSPLAFCVLNGPQLIIELANDNMLRLWGKTRDVIGLPHHQVRSEPDAAPFLKVLDEVYATGVPFTGHEVKAFTEKGNQYEWGYFSFTYQPLRDTEGNINGILAIVDDVTEAVLTRQANEQMNEQLSLAIEAAKIGTWYINPDTKELKYNATLAWIFGYEGDEEMTFDQAIGQVTDEYREIVINEIEKAISGNTDYDITYKQHRFNDGELIWLRSLGKVSQDIDGSYTVFSGVVMDVTEQKRDDQRKNDFIGMVSHELKTPLTSLTALVQVLQAKAKNNSDTFFTNALDKANTQVKKMSNMINGFLNVSRLESGKIRLSKEPFSLGDLVIEMIDEAKLMMNSHEIKLIPCGSITVNADRDKIGSVLSNLLSNAVKYSPKGKTVEVKCEHDGEWAKVSVKDEGIGIKPENISKLFDRYYRVENPNQRHISGFGIGLYLCSEIIQQHNGKISVESQPDVGSTFCFTLPLR
jgi:PAS domain S-box-containing protein